MASIPTPSRPATNPPTGALPPIPSAKPRKSVAISPDPSKRPSTPQLASKLRSPSGTAPRLSSQSSLPSLSSPLNPDARNNPSAATRRIPSLNSGDDKSLRRTVSVAAFPQPPRAGGRPVLQSSSSFSEASSPKSRSPERKPPTLKSRKSSVGPSSLRNSRPSLLDNSADGKSITSQDAEGRWSLPVSDAPPSGYSSARDSALADDVVTRSSSKRSSKTKEAKGNVIVSVRVRPDASNSDNSGEGEWLVDGRRALVSFRGKEAGDYFYDNVFSTHDNNAKVYDSCAKRLVRRVMEGYHGTVFAYGMTGTGKTFSMQGTASSPGVIPLAITDIFSYIRETPHREFLLRVSYLEIYNEKINDLLSAPVGGAITGPGAPQQEEIKLREDSKRGVYATPLKEEIVQSPTQLLRVIARGDHARRTGSTQFNARSSRSHAVVQIVVESRERTSSNGAQEKRSGLVPGGVRVSTLSLIDLAGSERAAEDKERRTEGAHINKSLLTLGTVIARLSKDKDKVKTEGGAADGKHLPYRDSKLTRLLQPALSGNSLVSILCTIQTGLGGSSASATTHTNETLNTLKFAARAKNSIVSHAKRAEESFGSSGDGGSRVLLERYRTEIQMLRAQLEEQAKQHSEHENRLEEKKFESEHAARHEEQMLEMQLARTALRERIEHLNRLILCSKSTGVNAGAMSIIGGMNSLMGSIGGGDTRSLRSFASHSTMGGAMGSLTRSASLASVRSGRSARSSHTVMSQVPMQMMGLANPDDEDDALGEFGDGMASLQMQVSALQADLADKNRYISTLERRIVQARRSSHSRTSMALKGGSAGGTGSGTSGINSQNPAFDNPDVQAALREKDMEIADLRMQLDDKDRMLSALRSATRQRDIAQMAGTSSPSPTTPIPGQLPYPYSHGRAPSVDAAKPKIRHPSTGSNSSSISGTHSNRDSNTNTNTNSATSTTMSVHGVQSNTGVTNVKPNDENDAPASPIKRDSETAEKENIPPQTTNIKDSPKDDPKSHERPDSKSHRRSVDEVSRMLDEMIQDRVESGQIVRGPRGSMRVASMAIKREDAGSRLQHLKDIQEARQRRKEQAEQQLQQQQQQHQQGTTVQD